jgi:PKD repeat protein
MKVKHSFLLYSCLFSFLLASERFTDQKHLKQADAVPLSDEEKQVHHRLYSGDKLYPGAVIKDFDFDRILSLNRSREGSSSASKKFSRSEKLRNRGNTSFMRSTPSTDMRHIDHEPQKLSGSQNFLAQGYFPQVAIAENGHIYVVYMTNESENTEYLSFYVYKSADGGETWTYVGGVYNTSTDINYPDIEVLDDRLIVVFEVAGKLNFYTRELEDEGYEFYEIALPDNYDLWWGSITSDKFYYGFDDTWLYLSYAATDTVNQKRDVFTTQLTDPTKTNWTTPVKLTDGELGAMRPGIAIAYTTEEAYADSEWVVTTWRDTLYNGYAGRVDIYSKTTHTEIVIPSESGTEGWGSWAPAVAAYWNKVFVSSSLWWGPDNTTNEYDDISWTFSDDTGNNWGTDDYLWYYWIDDDDNGEDAPTPVYSSEGVLGFSWANYGLNSIMFIVNSTGEFLQGWEAKKVIDSNIDRTWMLGGAIDSTTYHIVYDKGEDYEVYYHSEELVGSGTGTVSGRVTSALDGSAIEGAIIVVEEQETNSGSDGSFSIENVLPGFVRSNFVSNVTSGQIPLTVQFYDLSTVGAQEIRVTKNNFMDYTNRDVIIVPGETTELDISMTPQLGVGQYRFVLNWGAVPKDLDANLLTPVIEGQSYHIFWDDMGSESSAPYVALDIDDTTSFGPETITIYSAKAGSYKYFVHNYSMAAGQSTAVEFPESDASVQIYSSEGQIATLTPPRSKNASGEYWYVADIDGLEGGIKIINELQDSQPGSSMSSMALTQNKVKGRSLNRTGNTTDLTYSWDFGDGKKSTQTAQQNPTHTYTNNGTWDVTLTVSDGSNYSTTVFEGYIVSGTGSVIEELLLPEYFTLHQNYPNPFNPTTTISYDLPEQALVTLGIYDILGKQIKTLVNQSQDVGYKIVVWDGTDNLGRQMSAGVYLYQIEAGGFIQTRKMLYLK